MRERYTELHAPRRWKGYGRKSSILVSKDRGLPKTSLNDSGTAELSSLNNKQRLEKIPQENVRD